MKNVNERKTMIPRPEHPNPQWERQNWCNLNGEWLFEIDNTKSGEARGLQHADCLTSTITVPFCPESELSGINNKDFMLCVWYKRHITFDLGKLTDKRVILHFGAADYETKVWLNGKLVGEPHVGGYGSFLYDITTHIKDGDNLLTVACYDDTRSGRQASGKQSITYRSEVCKYTRTTGIWQTVWYEIVPESYIKQAKIMGDPENGSVMIDAKFCGFGDFSAEVFYQGKKVGEACKKNRSVTGQMEIKLSETHLWEIGNGRLYDLVLRFGEDEVKSYFGLRTIEMKDGKFYLNGKSVFQRLVLDQGYYSDGIMTAPTEEALIRDIQCGLNAGFNGARLHMKIFEPRYLYHADKLGYIVWYEYGNSGLDYSDLSNLAGYLPDWLNSMKRDVNHPCIVLWCPLNETFDYGPQMKRPDPRFARAAYEETKRYDASRPCIDTSGFFHVVTDVYDVHDYELDHDVFRETYEKLRIENVLAENWRRKGRQKWNGEPVAISEFGGIGYMLENNGFEAGRKTDWCRGESTFSCEEFYERYRGYVDVMLDNPKIFSFCYTMLTDIEQEKVGLYTYETREPKVDMSVIAAINSRKAAVEE